MADLINRQINLPWAVEFISVALIGGGYSTALAFLKSSITRFDPGLSSMRDLVLLTLVAAASAAFVASTCVGVVIAAGLLSIKDFAPATLRYWIGDVVGILALTPFALFRQEGRKVRGAPSGGSVNILRKNDEAAQPRRSRRSSSCTV
jgi:integral membrane sensor domain MASE1